MNKLIPFKKFTKSENNLSLSDASVVVDKDNNPLGFVFGRDSFISLCTVIDDEFEKRVNDPKKAFDNPAGKLIDLIEEKLPVNPKFASDLKSSIKNAKKTRWIPLEEVAQSLNV
ncbi:hypothetical protein HYW41_00290 [Candidatus Daviesbacteria bacterium]|nr:hypothetical protein [Candidatus Daviesbacteria bacterium]